jgi:hypothetical protein
VIRNNTFKRFCKKESTVRWKWKKRGLKMAPNELGRWFMMKSR